jgi:hypothetical protein
MNEDYPEEYQGDPGLLGMIFIGLLAIGGPIASVLLAMGIPGVYLIRSVPWLTDSPVRAGVIYSVFWAFVGFVALWFAMATFLSPLARPSPPKVFTLWWDMATFLMRPKSRRSHHRLVSRPPGSWLLALAEFFCSRKTYTGIFLPTIIDLRVEYCEALDQGKIWKARWVLLRGWCSFWNAAAMRLPISAVRILVRLWQVSGS